MQMCATQRLNKAIRHFYDAFYGRVVRHDLDSKPRLMKVYKF